jgi:hypothetical protein
MDRNQAPEDVRRQVEMLPTLGTVRALLDDLANEANDVLVDPAGDRQFVTERTALVTRAAAIRLRELHPPEPHPVGPPAAVEILDDTDDRYLLLEADPGVQPDVQLDDDGDPGVAPTPLAGDPGGPCAVLDVMERMSYLDAGDCEQLAEGFTTMARWLRSQEVRP